MLKKKMDQGKTNLGNDKDYWLCNVQKTRSEIMANGKKAERRTKNCVTK